MVDKSEPWGWAESPDAEHWDFAGHSRAEALEHARGQGGYIQPCRYPEPSGWIIGNLSADVINFLLDRLEEWDDAFSREGDPVYDISAHKSMEASKALGNALAEWAMEYINTSTRFTCVGPVEKVK